jgi:hypothetical protein
VTEPEALQHRRQILLKQLCKAADEIKRIDDRLSNLLAAIEAREVQEQHE